MTSSETQANEPKSERAWLYGLLVAPSAVVSNGVIAGGVLAYLLSLRHVSSGEQSKLIALLALPTSLYFLWAPITDFLVKRRTWLLIGGVSAGLLMYAAFLPTSLTSAGCAGADDDFGMLQPVGGFKLWRDDGSAATGAVKARGRELLPGWEPGVWGGFGFSADLVRPSGWTGGCWGWLLGR